MLRPSCFTPTKSKMLGASQSQSGQAWKELNFLSSLGLESYTIHPVICCCTNYTILATSHIVTDLIKLKKI